MRPITGATSDRDFLAKRRQESFNEFEFTSGSSLVAKWLALLRLVRKRTPRLMTVEKRRSISIEKERVKAWVNAQLRERLRPFALWGLDLGKVQRAILNLNKVRSDRREFARQLALQPDASSWALGRPYPIFGEQNDQGGQASGQYFHQDLYVAQLIFERAPRRHIDVGSSVYGFVSHVASFREIEVIDIRPVESDASGIMFHCLDLMDLPVQWHGQADSVSCLHVLEHIGLGRYGDDIAADGWLRGLRSLHALLEENGTLYLAVPTGEIQRIEFNAHRVFSLPYLRGHLVEYFEIKNLAFVDDQGKLIRDVHPFGYAADASMNATHGLSIWTLRKKRDLVPQK